MKNSNTPPAPNRAERSRIAVIRTALLAHYDAHRRDLPWRHTRDPYAIWVSEVMLQQTRVETVIPYYTRFLARFPTTRALADSPIDEVLALWAGLGYYRRARMLHQGARVVSERHEGIVPADRASLEALPGIGAYTAGAIASIAHGATEPVVDGNVERVLSRLFALEDDPRTARGKRRLWLLAGEFARSDRPGDVNQALMEFGATVCTPASPACEQCPLRNRCAARTNGADVTRLPKHAARRPPRLERWNALVITDPKRSNVWLETASTGRWVGMLVVPMQQQSDVETAARRDVYGSIRPRASACGTVTHALTHATMQIDVFRATHRASGSPTSSGSWVPLDQLTRLATPKITTSLIQQAGIALPASRRERATPARTVAARRP